MNFLLKVQETVLDLLFPTFCLGCGKEGSYLCGTCAKTLKRNEFQICPACVKKSPFGLTHPNCRKEFGLDGLISAVPYKEPLARKLLEYCKYKMVKDITCTLGELISQEIANQELQNYFKKFVLCPIPLHRKRMNWRGFNQAEMIAHEIAKNLCIEIQKEILIREKFFRPQAELKEKHDRQNNVKNAFTATHDLNGKKILLIDDVCTTGATLIEACRKLKESGADEVWACVFAQG